MLKFILSLAFICFQFISIAQVNLDQGLVFYTPFDSSPNDVSSNSFSAILTGATPANGRFGITNTA